MENEFVTYEQALALKELGFDELCFGYYDEGGNLYTEMVEVLKAPLYQQAFRFFREKYNLVFNFISYNIKKPEEYLWSITWNDEAKATGVVKTYEEAEQACLTKLIQIIKDGTRN